MPGSGRSYHIHCKLPVLVIHVSIQVRRDWKGVLLLGAQVVTNEKNRSTTATEGSQDIAVLGSLAHSNMQKASSCRLMLIRRPI